MNLPSISITNLVGTFSAAGATALVDKSVARISGAYQSRKVLNITATAVGFVTALSFVPAIAKVVGSAFAALLAVPYATKSAFVAKAITFAAANPVTVLVGLTAAFTLLAFALGKKEAAPAASAPAAAPAAAPAPAQKSNVEDKKEETVTTSTVTNEASANATSAANA